MKRILLMAFVAVLVVMTSATFAQRKNLTFLVNTATVPDTLSATSRVVLVGSGMPADADSVLTSWGAGRPLTNIGGDYWQGTLGFLVSDTLKYKIRIYGDGWEKDLSDGFLAQGHRNYIVTNNDTTFPVQFWNNGTVAQPQYFKPWTTVADSFINVYFRVNMKAVQDNLSFGWKTADKDSVAVRGGGPAGADLQWGTSRYLTQEVTPGDGASAFKMPPGSFFSGRLRFPKSAVKERDTIQYKFLLGGDWGRDELQGGKPNRTFTIPIGKKDTTLQWVYFNNDVPVARANPDTCIITFRVDLATAIASRGVFAGDTVVVQSGFFQTAIESPRERRLLPVVGSLYQYKDTIVTKVGSVLDYQYYLSKKGTSTRENYFNFQYTGIISAEQERRQILVPSKTFTINDTLTSVSAARRQPTFENQTKLAKNVAVKWVVNLRPAYYQILIGGDSLKDIQGSANVKKVDSIKVWGVALNGPATGGWGTWNSNIVADTSRRKMWDNGTNGDAVANDTNYTVIFRYTTNDAVGKIFKFGIKGGDNESAFGLNHLENVDDTDTTYTLNTQWGSINPNFYNRWNYDLKKPIFTGVEQLSGVALVYSLAQNYPNPFNPSTRIEFSIPITSNVQVKVFNVLGQEVATLANETLKAGKHAVTFDASKLASGMYFYRITAGEFASVKKMLLLK